MNSPWAHWLRGALVLSFALLGCGGASGGAPKGIMPAPETCGTVDPCGGDPTGTWTVLGGCVTPAGLQSFECSGATIQLTTLSFAGVLTLTNAMDYVATDFTEDRGEVDSTPLVCLSPITSCAEYEQALKSPINELSSVSCTGSTTCSCTVAASATPVVGDSGSYTILAGTQISFTSVTSGSSAGTYGPYFYCVESDRLHLIGLTSTPDSSGAQMLSVGTDIVLQKQ